MLLQNLRAKMSARLSGDRESGFTLIELLVVMLILGILAAIAIPAFFNQRDKAKDADTKAGVRAAQTAMETWATDHGGKYEKPVADTDLQAIEATLNDVNLTLVEPNEAEDGYTITATNEDTGNEFSIQRYGEGEAGTVGTVEYTCTNPDGGAGKAGCPAGGNWAG